MVLIGGWCLLLLVCWVTGFRGYGLGLVVGLDFLASLWESCGFCGLLVLLCIVALGGWALCFAGWVVADFGFAGFSLGWCLGVCGGVGLDGVYVF